MRWIDPVTQEEVHPKNLNKHAERVFAEKFKAAAGLRRHAQERHKKTA